MLSAGLCVASLVGREDEGFALCLLAEFSCCIVEANELVYSVFYHRKVCSHESLVDSFYHQACWPVEFRQERSMQASEFDKKQKGAAKRSPKIVLL